jgi:hypothetical protein
VVSVDHFAAQVSHYDDHHDRDQLMSDVTPKTQAMRHTSAL